MNVRTTPKGYFIFAAAGLLILSLLAACRSESPAAVYRGRMAPEEGWGSRPVWELKLYGENRAEMTLAAEQKMTIAGEAYPHERGGWIFYTDTLRWFGNWEKGWTEAEFSLTGSLWLPPGGQGGKLSVLERPAIQSVASASLRYGDTRYYGDRAAEQAERRWLRIERTAGYARDELGGNACSYTARGGFSLSRDYRRALEALLFPEVYGPSRDYPVPEEAEREDRYGWGEGYGWDRSYSERYLPEELRAIRDSGTLFRDYREGRGLFVLALAWGEIWEETIPLTIIE